MMWFVYIVTLSHWWKVEHVDVTVPTCDWLTGQCYDPKRAQTYEKTGSVKFSTHTISFAEHACALYRNGTGFFFLFLFLSALVYYF